MDNHNQKREDKSSSGNPGTLTTTGNYIYILEGKIGRIDRQESPIDIVGLCTDNFTTCNILVMFSKDRCRYVLAHLDSSLKEAVIQQQISWLGAEPSLFRIYRTDYIKDKAGPERTAAQRIPNLKNQFIAVGVEDKIESVHIGYADDYPVLSPYRPMQIQFHANSVLLALQHSITGFFSYSDFLPPVMFDGQHWTKYDPINLPNNVIQHLHAYLDGYFHLLSKMPLAQIDELLTERLELGKLRQPINAVSYLYLYFQYGSLHKLTKSTFLLERRQEFLTIYSGKFDKCHFTDTVIEYLFRLGKAANYQELKDLVAEIDTTAAINTIYSELLNHPRYEKRSDDEKKRIAEVQQGTLAQYLKLTTVCFELLFHRFLSTAIATQERQSVPKDETIYLHSSEQQKGESSSAVEFISSPEMEKRLYTQTITFLRPKISSVEWKEYPKQSLSGKYIGHKVLFFNMPPTGNQLIGAKTAEELCEFLKNDGFDATKRNTAKGNHSVVVDLTTSRTLKF